MEMEIKLNNQGQYVDVATGEIVELQHSMVVDETTINYIVTKVFGNPMEEHTKAIFGNKIVLDGNTTYTIEVAPYGNTFDLYVHNQSDVPMYRRHGNL